MNKCMKCEKDLDSYEMNVCLECAEKCTAFMVMAQWTSLMDDEQLQEILIAANDPANEYIYFSFEKTPMAVSSQVVAEHIQNHDSFKDDSDRYLDRIDGLKAVIERLKQTLRTYGCTDIESICNIRG